MTAKEKAKELVDKFSEYSHTDFNYSLGGYQLDSQLQNAKQCALIAVDEIFQVCPYFDSKIREDEAQLSAFEFQFVSYWEEVKVEISKIERL